MKNIKIIVLIISLLCLVLLYAENYMDLIAELTGEHPRSEFGFQVASLDFNGDGIDDLVVGAYKWDPEYPGWPAQPYSWGKSYFYLGPLGINNSVDFTISGFDSLRGFGKHLENLGDVNNDGYEDLGYLTSYFEGTNLHIIANILLGNSVMDSIPDYTYDFQSFEGFTPTHTPSLKWLGDINGDGYDDAGFVISKRVETNEEEDWVYLIYGNEFELHYLCGFDWNTHGTVISGIGNVNNDGFDDFIIGHSEYDYISKLLFWGGNENDSIPDMILTDYISSPYNTTRSGVALGDWNGDSIDDFNGGTDLYGADIWFGSETTLQQQMHLEFYDWLVNRNNDYGDLNADGRDDFVAGNDGGMAGLDGDAYVYLGCQNGTIDFHIEGEYGVGLGWSVAVGGIGRNSSGLNDCWCGKVYVYAGNPYLEEADPNISVEEEVVPKSIVEFNAYPNPFNPTVSFEIKVEGYDSLQIEIFNVKGQKVETLSPSLFHPELVEGRREVIWNAENQASGVYFCKLVSNKKILSVKKITLMK